MNTLLRRLAAITFIVAGGWPHATVLAEDATGQVGVQWQTTSQVTMEGMPFAPPPNKVKVCAAADPNEPPGSNNGDRGCVNSGFVREGLKVTWNSVCSGPPEMTGQGEITYSEELSSYSGAIRYATEDGPVTIKLSGEKIGACDKPR